MKRCLFSLVIVVLLVIAGPARAQAPVRPVPAIERVVIISIDGLRPDLLIRASTPNIQSLIKSGSFTFWARTTEISITLPSHVSMLTGLPPEKHGIVWNDDRGNNTPVKVPTVFELAKQGGYTTAMAAGKSKFAVLVKPGTLDAVHVPEKGSRDDDVPVAQKAAEMIRMVRPQLLMVHFPANDAAGHRYGWGSPEQIACVEGADAALGIVLRALDEAGLRAHTLIILTADHGGQGKSHGPNDARSRHIPWIASGPVVQPNVDLNLDAKLVVNTEDTFATALYVLGLPLPEVTAGKPVVAIFPKAATQPALPVAK